MGSTNPDDFNDGVTQMRCRVWSSDSKATFILGAQWRYADSESNAKEVLKNWKKEGFSVKGVKLKIVPNADGNWIVGAWAGRAKYLAAPLMAAVIHSGIFIQRLDDDAVWMLAASEGCVLPGHDLIVRPDEMSDILREWYSLLPDPTVYGDESGSQRSVDDCWQGVLDGIKQGDIDQPIVKASSLSPLGPVASFLSVMLVAGAAAGVVFLALSVIRGPSAPPVVDFAALDSARRAQEDASRQARLRDRFQQEVAEIRAQYASPFGAQEVFDLIDLLRDMRFEQGGAHLMSIDCDRLMATEQRSTWSCAPTWRNDPFAGLLYQAPLRAEAPEIGGNPEQGFIGAAFQLSVDKRPGAFAALHSSDWWLHALHDQFLASGITVVGQGVTVSELTPGQSVASMFAPEPIVVVASGFQEDGFSLQGVADVKVGDRANVRWTTSLAQLTDADWRAFWRQWPAQVERVRVDQRGMVTVDLGFVRLSAQP